MKKSKLLTLFLVLILSAALALTMVACADSDVKEPEYTVPSDLLMTNGDFYNISNEEEYPYIPSNWSGSTGQSSGDDATPSNSEALVKGVISTYDLHYSRNMSKWDKLANPGKKGPDNRVLMIYNKKETVYSYSLSGVSVKKNKTYVLSAWVKTAGLSGKGSANIAFKTSSGAVAEFTEIDTGGTWEKYSAVVRGSDISDQSFTVTLGLGSGNMQRYPVKGYAFFDNVTLIDRDDPDADDDTAYDETLFNMSETELGDKFNSTGLKKLDLRLADSTFDNVYISSTYTLPFSTNSWTGVRSYNEDDETYADSSSSALEKGVIDLRETIPTEINASNASANGKVPSSVFETELPSAKYGSHRALYINNKTKTAYGYRNKNAFRMPANSYVEISVDILSFINEVTGAPDGNNGLGSMVTLKLTTGSDGKDNEIAVFDKIDTKGEWKTYKFIVKTHNLRSRDLYLELWLGTGGNGGATNAPYNTRGAAFFDNIKVNTLSGEAKYADYTYTAPDGTAQSFPANSSTPENGGFAKFFSDVKGARANDGNTAYLELYAKDLNEGETDNRTLVYNGDFSEGLENNYLPKGWEQIDNDDSTVIANGPKDDLLPAEQRRVKLLTADTQLANFLETYGFENPGSAQDGAEYQNIFAMRNAVPTAYTARFGAAQKMTALPNTYYSLSVWVKTANIHKSQGVKVNLLKYVPYTGNGTDTRKDSEKYTSVASFDNINSDSDTFDESVTVNGWIELTFFIEGHKLDTTDLYLEITMGSQTSRFDSSGLVKGDAYVSNVTFNQETYSQYTSVSTDSQVKKNSLTASSDTSIANNNFDRVNMSDTESRFENEYKTYNNGYDEDTPIFDADGKLLNAFGSPENWTVTNSSSLLNMFAGSFYTPSDVLKYHLGYADKGAGDIYTANDRWDNFFDGYNLTGKPGYVLPKSVSDNILAIGTKPGGQAYLNVETAPDVCGCDHEACINAGVCDGTKCGDGCDCLHKNFNGYIEKAFGYTSPTISLTKNSYYKVTVWAKVDDPLLSGYNNMGSITLGPTSGQSKTLAVTSNVWTPYTFYIETGLSDISAKLSMFLGHNDPQDAVWEQYSGLVFFDRPIVDTLDADQYTNLTSQVASDTETIIEFTTDSFDNSTEPSDPETALNTPSSDWTLTKLDDEAPGTVDDFISGVYNQHLHSESLLTPSTDNAARLSDEVRRALLADNRNNFLVLNHRQATAYSYNNKSVTLAKASYYILSVDVFTWGLAYGRTAELKLQLNNQSYSFGGSSVDRKINTSTYTLNSNNEYVEEVGTWQTLTFYVATAPGEEITNVTLTISLGEEEEDNWLTGLICMDNIRTKKLADKDDFEKEAQVSIEDKDNGDREITLDDIYQNDPAFKNNNFVIALTDAEARADAPKDDEPKSSLLWLWITTGVTGGLIVLVVIVFFGRKLYTKYSKKKKRINTIAPYDTKKGGAKETHRNKDLDFKD